MFHAVNDPSRFLIRGQYHHMQIDHDIQIDFPGDILMQEIHQIRRELVLRWERADDKQISSSVRELADQFMTGYRRTAQQDNQPIITISNDCVVPCKDHGRNFRRR